MCFDRRCSQFRGGGIRTPSIIDDGLGIQQHLRVKRCGNRLSEDAEIMLFDRGPCVSFSDYEIPYCVGNAISDGRTLPTVSAEFFKTRFHIEVRTENEVAAIERERQVVVVKRLKDGELYRQKYDALVLAPGGAEARRGGGCLKFPASALGWVR